MGIRGADTKLSTIVALVAAFSAGEGYNVSNMVFVYLPLDFNHLENVVMCSSYPPTPHTHRIFYI